MSEPELITKDGKKAVTELAVASDLALPCVKCNKRKTMFLKAAFCEVCKLLWFDGDIERLGPAKKMLNRPEIMSFSKLERERLEWIIEYAEKPEETKYWNEWITEKSEDLFNEFLQVTHWTPGATDKKLGARGT